jgi:hypothetical protein
VFDELLLRTAAHEVAHSLVAYQFGIDVIEIRINGGIHGGASTWFDGIENPVAELAVVMAGEVAEGLFFGRAECCKDDRARIAEILDQLGWSRDDARVKAIRRMVKRILESKLPELAYAAGKMAQPGIYEVQW